MCIKIYVLLGPISLNAIGLGQISSLFPCWLACFFVCLLACLITWPEVYTYMTLAREPKQSFWEISEVGAAGLGWTEKVTKIIVLYSKNARDPLFCMRPVNIGVRMHCFLQQIRAAVELGARRGTHHRATKNLRQKPTGEALFG